MNYDLNKQKSLKLRSQNEKVYFSLAYLQYEYYNEIFEVVKTL